MSGSCRFTPLHAGDAVGSDVVGGDDDGTFVGATDTTVTAPLCVPLLP